MVQKQHKLKSREVLYITTHDTREYERLAEHLNEVRLRPALQTCRAFIIKDQRCR